MSQDYIERRGGARRGAGRPRKGAELRVTMSLSVPPATLERARELREMGVALNELLAAYIDVLYFDNTAPFCE